jgi:hypothetical protein
MNYTTKYKTPKICQEKNAFFNKNFVRDSSSKYLVGATTDDLSTPDLCGCRSCLYTSDRDIKVGKESILEAYSKWYAEKNWKLYFHATTIDGYGKVSDALVIKYFMRLIHAINKSMFGKRYARKHLYVDYVIGIERNFDGSHTHIHALIGGPCVELMCRKCIMKYWEYFTGKLSGIARIDLFDKKKATRGAFYLCKHQIKENNIKDFFNHQTKYTNKQIRDIVLARLIDKRIHIIFDNEKICDKGNKVYCSRKQLNLLENSCRASINRGYEVVSCIAGNLQETRQEGQPSRAE